jgi:dihydroflavonol-4-reductase
MPSILIAGATGFIGSRLCEKLHSQDYQLFALTRSTSDITFIKPYVHKFITSDLSSPSCIDEIANQLSSEHINYLVALVGAVDYHQAYEIARKANVDTTKSIIKVALHLQSNSGLKKMVFGGSVTSRGFMPSDASPLNMINESSDHLQKGLSAYCDVKREAEDLVNKSIKKDKLKAVIVEPGSIIGKPIGNTSTTNIGLIKKIIKGFPVLNGGASYTSLHKILDGIILAVEKGKIGESYLLGGENMTMKDFAILVRSILKDKFQESSQPMIPVFTIPETVADFLGKMNLIINSQQAVMGNNCHYIDSTKAKNKLGYRHSMEDLKKAIKEVLEGIL